MRYAVRRRVLTLILIVVTGAAGIRDLPKFDYFFRVDRHLGWDLDVVCSSLHALSGGQDPYLESKPLPLPYPVIHVYLWKPLCAVSVSPLVYGIVFTLIAAASAILLWRIVPPMAFDRIAVLAAIFLSFNAFRWQLESGNAAIVELPLAVTSVVLLAARRYLWAAVFFGLLASLKLLPLFGAIAFLCLPESTRLRFQSFALAIGSFLIVQALNAILFSQWLPSYGAQLMGRMPGGSFYEPGGPGGAVLNEDTIDFVLGVFQRFGIGEPLPGIALACLGTGVACLTAMACARKTSERGELPPVAVVSLVVLTLWLFLFRQKPYGFETFVPFMIAAGYGIGRRAALYAIAASILVSGVIESRIVDVPFLSAYYQLIAAWVVVLMLQLSAIMHLRLGIYNQTKDKRSGLDVGGCAVADPGSP
jgi:hypothetical protein